MPEEHTEGGVKKQLWSSEYQAARRARNRAAREPRATKKRTPTPKSREEHKMKTAASACGPQPLVSDVLAEAANFCRTQPHLVNGRDARHTPESPRFTNASKLGRLRPNPHHGDSTRAAELCSPRENGRHSWSSFKQTAGRTQGEIIL